MEKIGLLSVFKIQSNVLKKSGMVVFDGKVVMSAAILNQILGNAALGQQGIGGNIFALNIDGLKQRDGGLDFVGALELLVVCGQGAYFFWV